MEEMPLGYMSIASAHDSERVELRGYAVDHSSPKKVLRLSSIVATWLAPLPIADLRLLLHDASTSRYKAVRNGLLARLSLAVEVGIRYCR